jgi:hypothetical protein
MPTLFFRRVNMLKTLQSLIEFLILVKVIAFLLIPSNSKSIGSAGPPLLPSSISRGGN